MIRWISFLFTAMVMTFWLLCRDAHVLHLSPLKYLVSMSCLLALMLFSEVRLKLTTLLCGSWQTANVTQHVSCWPQAHEAVLKATTNWGWHFLEHTRIEKKRVSGCCTADTALYKPYLHRLFFYINHFFCFNIIVSSLMKMMLMITVATLKGQYLAVFSGTVWRPIGSDWKSWWWWCRLKIDDE